MKLILILCAVPVAYSGVIWEDNFDNLDRNKWSFERGNNNGWGNAELQCYTDRNENVRVENGHLVIEARRENLDGCAFTSARMITRDKFAFRYGTIEARIKLPNLRNGLWPAFWMLGAENPTWPDQGEIDIMEAGPAEAIAAGTVNRKILGTFHWNHKGQHAQYGRELLLPFDITADFHNYKLTWSPTEIRMYFDGQEYMVFDTRPLPVFQKRFYFVLNLAVGGNFPNIHDPNGITAPLPAQLLVDYVRVSR
ncbi:unnamed protein product [Bursaphelenchus xylophilus]|uniref:(pine wood nematode) hypothetical protein n=1 Tax=Bursaphelenchus xylophilus TaxID=6326 RepID=A0A1I7RX19_BURXY|nr:unnamed protein product [Bursaphelenchus xylophilus]CAG9121270.1 unnamed protein product [Bursaphelenchus xylophilus]